MNEQLLLKGIQIEDDLYNAIETLVSKDNRIKVLLATEPEKEVSDIAEQAGVSESTVKRARKELVSVNLLRKEDYGKYEKTISVLNEPILKELILKRLEEDG